MKKQKRKCWIWKTVEGGRNRTKRGIHRTDAISIVIDVKPWSRRRPFTAVSTVIVFRVSSRIRAAFPETYDRLDHPNDVRVLEDDGYRSFRRLLLDTLIADWISLREGFDDKNRDPTLSRSLSTQLALTSSFREERRDDERINAREGLELRRSYKIKWN